MEGIRWSAVASDEWIRLFSNGQVGTIVTGYGNTNIDIVVEPVIPGTNRDNGTITITSEDGSMEKIINVQRCGGDCGCDNVKTNVESVTFEWNEEGEGDKKSFMTIPSCVENESFVTAVATGNFEVDFSPINSIYSVYPVTKNETDFPKYGELTVQYGACESMLVLLQQNPNICNCGIVLVYDNNWDDDDSEYKTIIETKNISCYSFGDGTIEEMQEHKYKIGDVIVHFQYDDQNTPEGWFDGENRSGKNIKISSDKTKIYVRPNGDNNDDVDKYECVVNVEFLDSATNQACSTGLTLSQKGRGECECGYVIKSVYDAEWNADECGNTNAKRVASGINSKCVQKLSHTCDSNHFKTIVNDGVIYAYPIEPNTSITYEIAGTVTINYFLPDGITACDTITKELTHRCKSALYIHYSYKVLDSPSETYIPNSGASVEIKYYLSKIEDDDESQAITDINVLEKTEFSCPYDITCDSIPIPSNGIFVRTIEFVELSEGTDGKNWLFMIYHTDAVVSPKQFTIYQASKYENIIPNCDYFVFRYIWEDGINGKDLDSLTRISNLPNFFIHDGTPNRCNISNETVGMGGTAGSLSEDGILVRVISDNSGNTLLKFGGDNRCGGSEYTILCLKDLLKYGTSNRYISLNDKIYIDVYANWFTSKGDGKMNLEYHQYTGLTNGGYSQEIKQIVNTCQSGNYFSFEGKGEGICEKITSETISNLSVNAHGGKNAEYAKNISCLTSEGNTPYTHVFRLIYDVGKQKTSLLYGFEDTGVDISNRRFNINGVDTYSSDYTTEITSAHDTITFDNVLLKIKLNGTETNLSMFDSVKDYIELQEYIPSIYKSTTYQYRKSDFDSLAVKDFSFVHNFKITNAGNGKINISFDIDSTSENRQFNIKFFKCSSYIFECGEVAFFGRIETHQKLNL